ncbi:hypothetical protein P175DRAFT_0555759 [Aspergillus ochraceoroseus IBT 24754]|uniref:Uncharacterized protein n=1 Tax=Aspergillus ochraceoroseus IBT 24754 TaxID=1392256 RepID=A0A2T5M3H6_9EURO|nr:uncharacterized protein P175DRAFT_0555759 [Aspergillus ochraceoroseus IBT 24754]PTU23095.1 hypothetical protein P175DRAFT_0555759 [Aspergillus ochraceoroseus IBT 24754]
MTKDLTFDVRYDNELAHEYYGEGKKLADKNIYQNQNLEILDKFESTLTTPPVHFMNVLAPDDVDMDELKNVNIPPGLNIEILDFSM